MSQTEIIEEIRKLPADQQKEVVEAAMKFLKDDEAKSLREKEQEKWKQRMAQAAERLRDYYKPGSDHVVGEALDEKDFHDQR